MIALDERPDRVPLSMACEVLGVKRGTVYAWRRRRNTAPAPARRCRKEARQPRALSALERERLLDRLNQPEFWDQTPYQVYHTLLERGECLASLSTLYRVLRDAHQTGERRNQRAAQSHTMPRLTATRPNSVWTWDITKMATTRRGVYLNLYVVMDLFSRYVVAWMISRKENSQLAQQLIEETLTRYGLNEQGITLHQDRGSPMIAQSFLDLMADFGVVCSHSRPRVSNDNPYSESQFKTLKHQPDYPGRFESPDQARRWASDYFAWYNHEHHHSGLNGFTPGQVYTGEYKTVAKARQGALARYYQQHPERFVRGKPTSALPPEATYINPITSEASGREASPAVNFPTLPAARKALERANRE
jgi:putative transposase